MAIRQLQSLVSGLSKDRVKSRKQKQRVNNRRALSERLENRQMLAGPELIAIRPDAGALLQNNDVLNVAPREFNLLFQGGASLLESSINANSVRLIRGGSDGLLGTADDVAVRLGYVGLVEPGSTSAADRQQIVLRPASSAAFNSKSLTDQFPDDIYRIQIIGSGANPLTNDTTPTPEAFNDGIDFTQDFRLDRGAQVVSVVPQPVTRSGGVLTQATNQIEVYFDSERLNQTDVTNPAFYRLVNATTLGPASIPMTVAYNSGANRATLTFPAAIPAGSYRLDIGQAVDNDPTIDNRGTLDGGSSFDTSIALGALGTATVRVGGRIEAQDIPLPPLPGGEDDPGHRTIQREAHIGATGTTPVVPADVKVIEYYFPLVIGTFPISGGGTGSYLNLISDTEKQIVRDIFEIYAKQTGIEFIENQGVGSLSIGHGDLRALDPTIGPASGVAGLGGPGAVVVNFSLFNNSNRFYGDGFTGVMYHEIGHALSLGHSYDQPSVQGAGPVPNEVLPGDEDLLHLQRISPANITDIDLYQFTLPNSGRLNAEIFAERLTFANDGVDPSLLNSALALYRLNASGQRELIAQNDQYFGADAFLDLQLSAGTYFIGVSSTGNTSYDPNVPDSGFGGTTDGDYRLDLKFIADSATVLRDTRGTALDGDADGTPGGVYHFWFQSAAPGRTFFVDKLADTNAANTNQGLGTLASPFESIRQALAAAAAVAGTSVTSPTLVRIIGNGGTDGNLATLADNRPYLIGTTLDTTPVPLADGADFRVPQGVNVIIDAGTLIKLRAANIDAGSSSAGINRSGGSIQVFGTPTNSVFLRSYHDDSVGGNSDGVGPTLNSGQYGGIVFRDDSDREANGIFLNYVNHADIRHGGGTVFVDSVELPYTSIHITNARPTVSFNLIQQGNTAAISASPDSFDDSLRRIGPDIHGNYLVNNSIDGLFVRIDTPAGANTTKLQVSGRFDDTDITHVLSQNLIIAGGSGGPVRDVFGALTARPAGRLQIDPGVVVKLNKSRIEAERGAATLIAEGTVDRPIVFTSQTDKRYGGSGSFDTNRSPSTSPVPGDWAGLFFSEGTSGSIDHAIVTFGGGNSPIEGSDFAFNAVEIHQSDVRITNSLIENNAAITATGNSRRNGRGSNGIATIYVRGAQPTIVNNTIQNNVGSPIDINANSLTADIYRDRGRSTGPLDAFTAFDDNYGPLVRLNRLDGNSTGVVGGGVNGMVVRGEEVTVESVWDDTDIVHVVLNEVIVDNLHSLGGLTLQSSNSESLVIKLSGTNAGFTATGTPVEIEDRIGGTIHVIGMPGHPVVLTSLNDCTVGAGFTPGGRAQSETFGGSCVIGGGTVTPPVATGPLTITSTTNNGDTLRDALLGPGVTAVGNATFVGSATSAGTFTGGGTSIGIESGIVLSTGPIASVAGPNVSDSSSGLASGLADANLDAAFNVVTRDTTSLTFDFTSTGGDLFFNFVFASEEYNEFANTAFNDVFAFFLDGVNIALIPGTTTPVSINNVNGGNPFGTGAVNPGFFNNNDPSNAGGFLADFGMDGFTDVFTATASGLTAGTHTIKLAVSDTVDTAVDSAVFLQLGSFSDQPVVGTNASAGDWRGLLFDEFSNDRNVAIVRELENPLTNGRNINGNPTSAQFLGVLAPNVATPVFPTPDQKSGDDVRRLGFEIQGFISPDDGSDTDVYSFTGTNGTPIWIDIDRTDSTLDAVVEVIDATSGVAVATSVGPGLFTGPAATLTQNPLRGGDYYTQNYRDPGFYYVLAQPGAADGTEGTFFIRVSSKAATAGNAQSRGKYQLQIRTQQLDEFPGSTVRYADIRFASTAVDVRGLPAHSPTIAEAGEVNAPNDTFATAQTLVNLLQTDVATLGLSGELSDQTDVDWYQFDLNQTGVQVIGGVNDNSGTIAVVFDIDYANGAVSADTTIAVYDQNQRLVYIGRESDIIDDQRPDGVLSINDLPRGSLGDKDAYIGPIHLTPGLGNTRFYVAVMSNRQQPSALNGVFQSGVNPETARVRLEPVNSVTRVVEDHIGFQGYSSNGVPITPTTASGVFDISNTASLDNQIKPLTFGDVSLYVATDVVGSTGTAGANDSLFTYNPFTGGQYVTRVTTGIAPGFDDVQDIVVRSDGRMFGYLRQQPATNVVLVPGTVGSLVELDPEDGQILSTQNDNIQGPTIPNASSFGTAISNSHTVRADEFTLTDEVDAFTFERTGNNGVAAAPVPTYDTYYSVRESDTSSKLYRGRENGDASPSNAGANPRYGFVGDLQPAGVTFATQTLTAFQPVANAPTNFTNIRLESRIAGTAGNFTLAFSPTRQNNTNATVTTSTVFDPITGVTTRTITLNIGATGNPISAAATAGEITDAINSHPTARRWVNAVIVDGNSNNAGDGSAAVPAIFFSPLTTTAVVGSDGPVGGVGPLKGRVTGLSFGNFNSTGALYGVTNAGEFLTIDPNTGVVTTVVDAGNTIGLPNLDFQGLSLGPQNVEGTRYRNTLFAVTGDGQIVAFDTSGNGDTVFDTNVSTQLVSVLNGTPNVGYFTLTSDAGLGANPRPRFTTVPIAHNAPATISVNETQSIDTVGDSGTFTLSLVDDQGAITSPSANNINANNPVASVNNVTTTINVESTAGFPAASVAAPFVIQIDDEEMLVTGSTANTFTVVRGRNGTTAVQHFDTSSVFEIVKTTIGPELNVPIVSSTVAVNLDNSPAPTTLTVASAVGFPAAPFTIRVDDEEMLVTNVVGTDFTVQRQQNSTPLTHHNSGRIVTLVSASFTVRDAVPLRISQQIRIDNEDFRIVNVNTTTNTITAIRGINGTTPVAHANGRTAFRLDTTTALSVNATLAQVQAALAALPSVGAGNVVVTGGPLSGNNILPESIVFQGTLRGKNLQPLTADVTRLVGDEIQTISLDPNVNDGMFQLEFGGAVTGNIPFNATVAQVQAALDALPTIRPGNVLVTQPGAALPLGALNFQFVNELQDQDVGQINVAASSTVRNEIQRLAYNGPVIAGSFRLSINDPNVNPTGLPAQTGVIAFDATAAAISNALTNAYPGLGGNLLVGGGPLNTTPVTIEFINELAGLDIADIIVIPIAFNPGTTTLNRTTTQTVIGPVNEQQTIAIGGGASSGDFTLTINDINHGFVGTTAAIPYNADAPTVLAALLLAFPTLTDGITNDIVVTGGPLDVAPITIEFVINLAGEDIDLFVATPNLGPVGATVSVATTRLPIDSLTQNEQVQLSTAGPVATGGSFQLQINDPINQLTGTSNTIAWNAGPLAVRNAIENGIPALFGHINVTGGALPGTPIVIEFINKYAGLDIDSFTLTGNTLAPANASIAITTPRNNVPPTPIVGTTRDGRPVDVPITQFSDGLLSVFDALDALPIFDVTNVRVAGDLQAPGVTVSFIGALANATINPFDVNNFLMTRVPPFVSATPPPYNASNTTIAQVAVSGGLNDGLADSSIMTITGFNSGGNNANQRPIGLAFSPFDFSLWHPTTRRSTDVGHGVGTVANGTLADSSRTPGNVGVPYASTNGGRQFNQGQGGASLYFGFEPWLQTTNTGSESYLTYGAANAQYGISTTTIHQDLSSNPAVALSYNLPGGAFGSLRSEAFDLSGTQASDRPTLYFSYFLDTEDHQGSTRASDGTNPFRDSARVWASRDGLPKDDPNKVWELLATNNSQLSDPNPLNSGGTSELAGFLSHLSDAGLNSTNPRPERQQIRQELFDNTGLWRQARVDLSTFAGVADVQLRFDFSTSGNLNDSTLNSAAFGSIDGNFGEFSSATRSIRSLDNFHEGFYIDDIIVGYAERGEMVTNAGGDSGITDLTVSDRTRNRGPGQSALILNGPYQLEIRRTGEYENYNSGSGLTSVGVTFGTNDRHVINLTEVINLDFESGVFPSNVPIDVTQFSTVLGGLPPALNPVWSATTTRPQTGAFSLESGDVSTTPASVYQVTSTQLGGMSAAGVIEFSFSVDSSEDPADTDGLYFFIDGLPQNLVPIDPDFPGTVDPRLAKGDLGYQTVRFSVPAGVHTFTWLYDARTTFSGSAFIDNVTLLEGGTGLLADENREREQGQFIIESSFISDFAVRGINVQPGAQQGSGGGVSHPGSLINFPQTNAERLIPGVVIQNNVIVGGGTGIRFAGETATGPQRPVPFGRIVNNTLVGTNNSTGTSPTGIGVDIVGIASPTILNNLFTSLATSINNGSTAAANASQAPIIRTNFFQSNANNPALGTEFIDVGNTGSPFVDAINRNYYLQSGSLAIDSSRAEEFDRANYVTFKTALGIPSSTIAAPLRDVYGQLRIDSSGSTTGGGSSVFIDRGAVDRSDKDAPYAVLLNPIDNDAADRDPNETVVHLTNPVLENFKILLGDGPGVTSPFEGTGVNGLTVQDPLNLAVAARAVIVVHDGQPLIQGIDYTLGYDPLTGILLLTPFSSLWDPTGVYTITLDNTQIEDLSGRNLRPNQTDGTTRFFILMPDVRLDFGDAPDSFKTLLTSNAARHTIQPGATPRLGRRIDSEVTGVLPAAEDDAPQMVVATSASPLFSTSAVATGYQIDVTATTPTGGEQLTVTIGDNTGTFELVALGFAAQQGNIAVDLTSTLPADIARDFAAAIRTALVFSGDAAVVTSVGNRITVETFDDEDGLGVGSYTVSANPLALVPPFIVFLQDGKTTPTATASDVLGFLNPSDLQGTKISISAFNTDPLATTAGLLDAWIDFNNDGAFDPNTEQIFTNEPLNNGLPTKLTVITPPGTASGTRWARFRISENGNLSPSELAIGGEVEDYLVEIIDIAPTVPVDDMFTIDEDTVLDTVNDLTLDSLFNEVTTGFLPPRFIIETQPANGTLTVADPINGTLGGRFIYEPATDFYGVDSFTYWVSTQPEPGTVRPANATLATVTININPVNDAPLAVDRQFAALEETSVTITAAQLLAGSLGHASPQYVSPTGATYPWDESNQDDANVPSPMTVVSINIDGTDYNTSSSVTTARGVYTLNFAAGVLVNLTFLGNQDLNRDNSRLASDPIILETFTFTIRDNGISRDPVTDADRLGTPEEATGTATINVAPLNDTPTVTNDMVSLGVVGTTTTNTPWRQFFASLLLPVPQPTEDTTLTIPAAFLLRNDLAGSVTALDENNFISNNDRPLRITNVSVNNRDASVSINSSGNVVFVPPTDVYGDVEFTYTVTDTGIDEDLLGNRTVVARMATGTVTVTLQPINDVPVTYPRAFTFAESASPGVDSPAHVFTAAELLNGSGGELPSVTGLFASDLPAPFNESNQALRVSSFTTSAGTVNNTDPILGVSGSGTLTLPSDGGGGGRFEFDFVNFAFTTGRFIPRPDYNQRTPFAATETFRFTVQDDGQTVDPQLGNTVTLGRQQSAAATATILVTPTNDAPLFNVTLNSSGNPEFDFLEDGLSGTVIPNAIVNIQPGPSTASDELTRQFVSFNVLFGPGLSSDPFSVMAQNPTIADDGTLTIFPAPNAVGTAIYVFDAIDREPGTVGFVPRTTRGTLTVNVRPINDAPGLSALAGTSSPTGTADENWAVSATDGTIRYTLKEDNTGAGGATSPFIIDTRLAAATAGRVGLLDPFTVGPANEANNTLGGSQILRIISFPVGTDTLTTPLNGIVRVVVRDANGFPTRFEYTPPTDYNSSQGGVDSFSYTIEDDATALGETWSLTNNGLFEDRLTRTGTVEFLLNPVNDQPLFTIPNTTQTVLEDSGAVIVPNFATDVLAGPLSAGDELTGQTNTFTVVAQSPENGLFLVSPAIDPNGSLTFTSAPDAVGSVVYVVNLSDNGANDNLRGDINSNGPVTITIHVRPVNDQPRLNTAVTNTSLTTGPDEAWAVSNTGVITYTLAEDNTSVDGVPSTYIIDSRQTDSAAGRIGLLDPFTVGPANEADGTLGGSQIIRISSFPVGNDTITTSEGGTVRAIARDASGFATQFEYTPPTNYNSRRVTRDFFTFNVQDDATDPLGETWNLGSNSLIPNLMTRTGRVEFLLNPVNDRPLFTIPNVIQSVLEDSGAATVVGFANGIFAGPASAPDELNGTFRETVAFTLTPTVNDDAFFVVKPAISPAGTLTFTPAADAVGTIEYVVNLTDSGTVPSSTRGDLNSAIPVTITINLRPVNDAPRLNSAVIGTSLAGTNESWRVDSAGEIEFTLPEDNTQSPGVTTPFVIDVRRANSTANRIGLLDPFTVGPPNEAGASLGGLQQLRIIDIPATTLLNGILTVLARDVDGFVTQIGYTPRPDYNSSQVQIGPVDSFTYTFEDDTPGIGETSDLTGVLSDNRLTRTGRVKFVLTPQNDAPVFSGAADVTVSEDSTTTAVVGQTIVPNFVSNIAAGPVGAVDELQGLTPQTVSFIVTPVVGNPTGLFSVVPTVDASGTLSFTTNADANGLAQFTITAVDSQTVNGPLETNRSTPVPFVINVTAVNDPPTFIAGADVTVAEDSGPFSSTTPFATSISPGPLNESSQTVSFIVTLPSGAESLFSVQPTISPTGFLTFTPADDAVGTVVLSVVARDSLGGTSLPVPLTIMITEVNDAPVANDFSGAINEDATIVLTNSQFLTLAVDPDLQSNPNEQLTVVLPQVTSTLGATVTIDSNGNVIYDPRQSATLQALRVSPNVPFSATDTFTYRLRDTAGDLSDPAVVTITVTGLNDAPVAVDDPVILLTGPSTLTPLANDFDVDGTIRSDLLIVTQQPTQGSLSVNPDGTLIYTPRTGFRGVDTIKYTVGDNLGQQSEQATITLNVAPLPAPPNVSTGSFMGQPATIDLTDADVPVGTLDFTSIVIVRNPTNGVVTIQVDGLIIYEADPGFVGVDDFDFTIADMDGRVSNPVTVTVRTTGSALQNPLRTADVNASGKTTPVDALLIINRITRGIRSGESLPITVKSTDVGPNFFDVNGDGRITGADALLVINTITRELRRGTPEGESASGSGALLSAPDLTTASLVSSTSSTADVVSNDLDATFDVADIAADTLGHADDSIELLAFNASDDGDEAERKADQLAAFDAAWGDFSKL